MTQPSEGTSLPPLTPESRRIAAGQFERANQVIATGNHDYGIQLLLTCCKLDPGSLIYRQALRQTEKAKYKNNLRGSRLALITTSASKAKLKNAKRQRDYVKVLEHGEDILTHNPWDTGAQLDMSDAAMALGLGDMAVWFLDQARQKDPKDVTVNRKLARMLEERGNFTQAMGLWNMVAKADPKDLEAQHKAKDLAATETIARGQYGNVITGKPISPKKSSSSNPEIKAPTPSPSAQPEAPKPVADRLSQETKPWRTRLEGDPTDVNSYLQLALVYRRSGHLEDALKTLREGLQATNNAHDLMMELVDVEVEPFRRDLDVTNEKLKTRPQDEELKKVRSRLLKEINTRELDLYRQKSDRYPTEHSHRYELGVRLMRAGQVDEAIRELQIARSDPRNKWKALQYLGHCFKARHNWRLAQRNFEEALEGLPAGEEAPRKEIMFQLALGAAEAGDLPKAIDTGMELANLDFSYRDIGRLLDEWQNRKSSMGKD